MPRKVSIAQEKVMANLYRGDPVDVGFHGMSQMGGLHGTLRSLIRRGWMTEKHHLTVEGRRVYLRLCTPARLTPSAADMKTSASELPDETLLALFRGEASDTDRLEELRNELLIRLCSGHTEEE